VSAIHETTSICRDVFIIIFSSIFRIAIGAVHKTILDFLSYYYYYYTTTTIIIIIIIIIIIFLLLSTNAL